ncbi:MAG: sensor domain-containing phosphodiesterase, partial [Solirubrobacteraceae bacterium]
MRIASSDPARPAIPDPGYAEAPPGADYPFMSIHHPGDAVESLSLLHSLESSAPFGFGLIDLDWRYVRVNPALAAMNGLSAEEHAGRFVGDVLPQLWPQVEPLLADLVKSGDGVITRELVAACPSAPARPGTWLCSFFPVRSGAALVGIGFIVLDVTEQRQAEGLRSVIMQTIVDGLLAVDHDGRLTCMNAAAEQMLGWTECELRGRHVHDVIHAPRPDGARRSAEDCPLLGVRTRKQAIRSQEDAFARRDGRILPVVYSASPEPGGGVVIVFRDATEEIENRRRAERELNAVTWVGRIREALDEDRLELYSQPIMPLTGGAAREEVLLRMITRDGNAIAASEFLPAAERFGLIAEIDRWVIPRAVRFAGLGRIVHVNLSAASTADARLLDLIEHELREAGAPPGHVIFELTETALMSNAAAGEAFAAGLRELGCGLALDDFGTGFGSLTYLKRLPAESLKIDVDFVRDLANNTANKHLVQGIVSLARSFDKQTIAEGVEDLETLELLRTYGVDYAQGYFIGRPAPAAAR